MLSKQFKAPCYHILDANIPLDADGYMICSFDINLIEKEIEFVKKVQANGAKVIVGFSQDMRFLHGGALMSSSGTLWTSLCEVADVISSGVNIDLKIYGRFQHKVIPLGEVLEDYNWTVPEEEKLYDLIGCGSVSEHALSFQLEFLLMAKEKFPDHRIACVIAGQHLPLIEKLRPMYPQIDFPYDPDRMPHLIDYIKKTKVFFNPEIRPRPGRVAMECYYCRVPFIASRMAYHSRLCEEFSYTWIDFQDMLNKYSAIVYSDKKDIISKMEERAKFDMFDQFYKRISDAFGW
jgi:hypothetical protein